jgi:hypothetical protein
VFPEQDQTAPETHPNSKHFGRYFRSILAPNPHGGFRMCLKPPSELVARDGLRMMYENSGCLFTQPECFKDKHFKGNRLRWSAQKQ